MQILNITLLVVAISVKKVLLMSCKRIGALTYYCTWLLGCNQRRLNDSLGGGIANLLTRTMHYLKYNFWLMFYT